MLTRLSHGRTNLINLCGKKNVRNCDLSQRDFFLGIGPSWGWHRDFFGVCSKICKKMRPRNVVIFTHETHATKSHLFKLIFRGGRNNISGPERVSVQSTAEMKLRECLAHVKF